MTKLILLFLFFYLAIKLYRKFSEQEQIGSTQTKRPIQNQKLDHIQDAEFTEIDPKP